MLDAAPKDSNVWLLSGMAKAGANDLKGAQKAYENAIKFNDKNIDAHRELAITYAKTGQAPKADAELTKLKTQADAWKDSLR